MQKTTTRETESRGADRGLSKYLDSCKKCKRECSCPLGIEISSVLKFAKDGKFSEAKHKLVEVNPFVSVCSRICPAPCQDSCPKGVRVREILRFLSDSVELTKPKIKSSKAKIAVVGGGLAGLTASYHLAGKGYSITIFEALPRTGGFLNFKIPEFRLPREILQKEMEFIKSRGINVKLDTIISHAYGIPQLLKEFSAVLVCTGANKPAFMNIPGESLLNVYTANEFLSAKHNVDGLEVFVIGGGNSAVDAARQARRMGGNATIMYRRTIKEMPADASAVQTAVDEGVKFLFLTRPVRFIGAIKVEGIECEQLMLGERDFDERPRPIPIAESNFTAPCERVIVAVGSEPNPSIGKTRTIRTIGKERIWVDNSMTSTQGVFAAGDVVSNGRNVITTIKSAIEAVEEIDAYLANKPKKGCSNARVK